MTVRANILNLKAPFALLAAIALLLVNGHTLTWRGPPPQPTSVPAASSGRFDQAIVHQRDRSPVLRNQARQPNPGMADGQPILAASVDIVLAPMAPCPDAAGKEPTATIGGASSYSARAPPSA